MKPNTIYSQLGENYGRFITFVSSTPKMYNIRVWETEKNMETGEWEFNTSYKGISHRIKKENIKHFEEYLEPITLPKI